MPSFVPPLLTRPRAALATVLATLALAGSAGATVFGIADEPGRYPQDGAAFFSSMLDVGLTESRITLLWDHANPGAIPSKTYLDRAVALASARGVRVVFHVYPASPTAITDSLRAEAQFARFLEQLARTYPQVKSFIVGNEPNQPRFWKPQFVGAKRVAGAAYETLLARAYDRLKAVDQEIQVIGLAISARGNDRPTARNNVSTSPVRFLRDLGAAYRASGRELPIMDQLSFHPYPNSSADPLGKGYKWPNAGVPNLDRIKQATWDAFHGTAQPTFEEGLTFKLDEVGWQVGIVPSAQGAYFGEESTATTDEATQASIYAELARSAPCDPSVEGVLFFGLADESDLDRFQAGLMRADGTRRPSYDSVKTVLAQTGGHCAGRLVSWQHTESVIGAAVKFRGLRTVKSARGTFWGFTATAAEDARYKAGIFRVSGPLPLSVLDRTCVLRSLGSAPRLTQAASRLPVALLTAGLVKASWSPLVRFPERRLRPGWYVYAVNLRAAMAPDRVRSFVSKPFRVGKI